MPTINDLFDVSYGNKLDMNKMQPTDKVSGIAFVGRKGGLAGHAGVSGYVVPIAGEVAYAAGTLTVALGGSRLLSSYVQQRPFYTAQNVAVLTPRDPSMSLKHRLYYAMCIRHNAFRYTAFGREANRTLGTIQLPGIVPAWVDSVEIPTHEGLAKSASPTHQALSDPYGGGWREFRLDSLFEIKKGRRLTKASREPGPTPFVGASEKNNGITDYAAVDALHPAGVMTVVYNGNSVGFAFYQPTSFYASDDVNVLYPLKPMSKWALLFIATLIKHQRPRFTYGYKWTLARMQATSIRLPATSSGDPDLEYMQTVMRGLPFSAAVEDRASMLSQTTHVSPEAITQEGQGA